MREFIGGLAITVAGLLWATAVGALLIIGGLLMFGPWLAGLAVLAVAAIVASLGDDLL